MGPDAMILILWMLSFKPTFSLSSFTCINFHLSLSPLNFHFHQLSSFTFYSQLSLSPRLFSSSSLSAIRVVSSAYLRLLIFLPAERNISPAFLLMYSAYKLNKQGDNIQPWYTPFPIWNQSIVPCLVLTVGFWHAYRFLKRQVRWSGIPISFRMYHSLLWSTPSKALASIKQK